jgi:alpha-L-fucosidase
VSKNGNLLLGIAPDATGVFPEQQTKRILEIGAWLSTNGEAIYDTRPWSRASGSTADGLPVRYTSSDAALFAIVLGEPANAQLAIEELAVPSSAEVRLLGHDAPLVWEQSGANLVVTLPEQRAPHALALKITPKP